MYNIIKKISIIGLCSSAIALVGCPGGNNSQSKIDLDRVSAITLKTLSSFEKSAANTKDEKAMETLTQELQNNYNYAVPKLTDKPMGVALVKDGSFDIYDDANKNSIKDSGEGDLFKVQMDGEKQRIIVSDNNQVRDQGFSGMGLMAGFLMGSLLNRQRAAGVSPQSLSQKKATPKSTYRSARSRAGAGSHRTGK